MTDHKFETFQQVLVWDDDSHDWNALLYSHRMNGVYMCGGVSWKQCIPYTPDTEHLLGTPQPYEPPKPPQEYDLVEALEQAEAENDRLTKMVDWLADKLAEQNICRATHNKDKTISLRAIDADEWKEAALRAVAESEGNNHARSSALPCVWEE